MRSEFDLIQNIKTKYGLSRVGDDCAVLPRDGQTDLVITADMLVEDIDFRLDWTTPGFLGHKALAVSLSDIAAMGARPEWAMLSIGVPELIWKGGFLDRFYAGWHELAGQHGVELVGGDVSRSSDKLIIDSTVLGSVAHGEAILRSTAREGDWICVSGSLGGAAGGLSLLESGRKYDPEGKKETRELLLRQLRPQPRLDLSTILSAEHLASAMIDISDGFSSDLHHLCRQSGVGAFIGNISVDKNLYTHFKSSQCVDMALHGGEDFELLFTVPPEKISRVEKLPVIQLGVITPNIGMIEVICDENKSELKPKGYRHF